MSDNNQAAPPPPISVQIRKLRQERGLTLAELAEQVGTSTPTMHRYESGWDRFELRTLDRIAAGLGARLEVRLIPGEVGKPPPDLDVPDLVDLLAPLFWDHVLDEVVLAKHPAWVLARTLVFGDAQQVSAARAFYGDDAVCRAVRRREVDPRTRNYWNLILEDRCTPRS